VGCENYTSPKIWRPCPKMEQGWPKKRRGRGKSWARWAPTLTMGDGVMHGVGSGIGETDGAAACLLPRQTGRHYGDRPLEIPLHKRLEAWAPCGTQEPHESPYLLAFEHGPTFKWAMWRLNHLTMSTSDLHLFPTLCFFALAGSTFKTSNFAPQVLKCSQKFKKNRNEVL
jgi:hypothetical protein